MDDAPVWKPPRSAMSENFNGLLDRIHRQNGIHDLDAAAFEDFMAAEAEGVVLLTDDPDIAPESWDLAVILPELCIAAGIQYAAFVRPEHVRPHLARFGVGRLPALLFVRDGGYVGTIEGLRDWSELVAACAEMAARPVSRAPSVGIAVNPSSSACH